MPSEIRDPGRRPPASGGAKQRSATPDWATQSQDAPGRPGCTDCLSGTCLPDTGRVRAAEPFLRWDSGILKKKEKKRKKEKEKNRNPQS